MSVMLLDNPYGFKLLNKSDSAMLTSRTGSLLGDMMSHSFISIKPRFLSLKLQLKCHISKLANLSSQH